MATLKLVSKDLPSAALKHERIVPLRDWLQGHWAAVCSDPDDFAPPRGTPAGFVTCIAEGLRASAVKLIAFDRTCEPALPSWLDHAVNDDAVVLLDRGDACIIDLAEHALAAKLATLSQRFVVIVDERGRIRTTLNYRVRDRSRSLFDLVELVAALRDGTDDSRTARQASVL
jgi:alkyl hydroperoxide reductase subunit AhpC